MKIYKSIITISAMFLTIIFTSCATHRTSTIVGFDYDKENNRSEYFVAPFGSVSIPGKWEKTKYLSSSKQQYFINDDSVSIAIALGSCQKIEFNIEEKKSGWDFVKSYYEWDSKFFVERYGLKRTLIEENKNNNFIIWRLFGFIDDNEYDVYFLYGEANCNVKNISVQIANNWSANQKTSFLKELFINK